MLWASVLPARYDNGGELVRKKQCLGQIFIRKYIRILNKSFFVAVGMILVMETMVTLRQP